MEIVDQIVSLSSMIGQFWRDKNIATILLLASAVVLYFRGHVKSEKMITHTRDVKTTDEMNALREKMKTMLTVIEAILYEGVFGYSYDLPGGSERRIMVVRHSKPVSIKAGDYLEEYHRALHKAVIETAPNVLMNELLVHRVSESPVDSEQESTSARNLRNLICYEIHGHAGVNRQIKDIENNLLPYEEVCSMYVELCAVARNLRAIRELAVEQEILEHRIPFFPKIAGFLPRKRKKR